MSRYATSSSRWKALMLRDPAASSAFIYGVTSTKIYCRPDCPSRLARRANIVFHDTAAQAEAAGFRACLRCRPSASAKDDLQKTAIRKACALVDSERNGRIWSVKDLGREAGLTESHFCRTFKKIMGCTVGDYRAMMTLVKPIINTPLDSPDTLLLESEDVVWSSFVDFGPE